MKLNSGIFKDLFTLQDGKSPPEKRELLLKSVLSAAALLSAMLWVQYQYGSFRKEFIVLAVAAQCIGGVYLYKHNRLKSALIFATIVIGISALAVLPHYQPWLVAISVLVFAAGVSYANRFFPQNAGDVIIPGSLIFFIIIISAKTGLQPVLYTASGAAVGLVIQIVFMFIALTLKHLKRREAPSAQAVKADAKSIAQQPVNNTHPGLLLNAQELFYSAELAVLLFIAALLVKMIGMSHSYWFPFTVVALHTQSGKMMRSKISHRLAGTLFGCICSYLLFMVGLPQTVKLAIILLSNGLFVFFVRYNFMLASWSVTLFVLMLSDYNTPANSHIIIERFLFTGMAGVLVYVSSFLPAKDVFPTTSK